jgi:3-deoxy-7-phosphoheptulonate synthase
MAYPTNNLRITSSKVVIPPIFLEEEMPLTDNASRTVFEARRQIVDILNGTDDRLIVVVGPCSIHDPIAAREYAKLLKEAIEELSSDLMIVMRVYFEKPRTTLGWKGLINDPYFDESFRISDGLRIARRLLLDLAEMGVPAGTEYLDMISPQYVADLVSWGAIGARTTESQVHRQLASGLSCPVGFKNGTSGNVQIAIEAILSASHPRIMIDCSHANSGKDHRRQGAVCRSVSEQIAGGESRIMGVMIESNLVAGAQTLVNGKAPVYGQSITDACIDWAETETLLRELANATHQRRAQPALKQA